MRGARCTSTSRSTWARGRCGVVPGEAAVALAKAASAAKGLRFRGLHAYHGAAQHLRTADERRAAIERASALAGDTRQLIERAGIACPVITGAGTGTWQLERDSHVYTELQPGSYVFMDADYARNALAPDEHAFEHSLYVLCTVMSVPTRERAVVDAGLKALAVDSGLPEVHAARGLRFAKASDEHGVLEVDPSQARTRDRRSRVADPGPLRPDRQSLRLARRDARAARRMRVACLRARGSRMTTVSISARATLSLCDAPSVCRPGRRRRRLQRADRTR